MAISIREVFDPTHFASQMPYARLHDVTTRTIDQTSAELKRIIGLVMDGDTARAASALHYLNSDLIDIRRKI